MDAFLGSWERVSTENLNNYMKALDVGDDLRSVANTLNPVVTFSRDCDSVVIKTETVLSESKIRFRLGKEFEEKTADGRHCKSVINLEKEKLVQVQRWEDKEARIIREIQDGKLILTAKFGEVSAVITFKKL